jgi:hypothetical protein
MTGRVFSITHRARPWTTNHERRLHPLARAKLVRDWRSDACWLAAEARIPHLEQVTITATPHSKTRRSLADCGACLPSVKASVDGLVDYGVLDDDDATHVLSLTFYPTVVGDFDGLVVEVVEVVGELAS